MLNKASLLKTNARSLAVLSPSSVHGTWYSKSMAGRAVGAGGGGVLGLGSITGLMFTLFGSSSPPLAPPIVAVVDVVESGGLFAEWPDLAEGEVRKCEFWNGTVSYAPSVCEPFAITRIGAAAATRAINRAIECAAGAEEMPTCVLSHELGFGAPAAFLYSAEAGFEMLLAPRLLQDDTSQAPEDDVLIRLTDPHTPNTYVGTYNLNRTVKTEFISPGSRAVHTRDLRGDEAYCVQLLRLSTLQSCWHTLD